MADGRSRNFRMVCLCNTRRCNRASHVSQSGETCPGLLVNWSTFRSHQITDQLANLSVNPQRESAHTPLASDPLPGLNSPGSKDPSEHSEPSSEEDPDPVESSSDSDSEEYQCAPAQSTLSDPAPALSHSHSRPHQDLSPGIPIYDTGNANSSIKFD